jgi:predicted AlkP superfamily pyrophosphatase or phosphodiesterase
MPGTTMRWYTKLATAALAALLPACPTLPAQAQPSAAAPAEVRAPVTILVSIDGFRADYLDRGITPTLSALAADGVRAAMRPSFPTKTFPNHYAIVTGLRPDRNGIIANKMEDARRPGKVFTMSTLNPFWWDEAEPVWVAAEHAGIRTGPFYWPGAAVKVHGTWPSDWAGFNHDLPNSQRVDAILDWLRRPAAKRPRFLTLYFNTVDDAGHDFGPDAPETDKAIAEADSQIAALRRGLAELGQPANLIILADHGMAEISPARTIKLDRIADPADWRAVEDGVYVSLHARPGRQAALEKALLRPHDHMQCWRKADIPERLHYGRNSRVPPYFCLADIGWQISALPPDPDWVPGHGNHGWDNKEPQMLALFVANGPAFAHGVTLPTFDNVDVYPLLRDLLGLPPAKDVDGTDAPFKGVVH